MIVGFEGDKAIETNVAVTVIFVEALTVPMEAVIVVVPTLNELTIPALPAPIEVRLTDNCCKHGGTITSDRSVQRCLF